MHFVTFVTFDLDIQHLRVDTEGQVAWQCPRCGCPGDQSHFLILNQWEVDDDRRVLNVLKAKAKQRISSPGRFVLVR